MRPLLKPRALPLNVTLLLAMLTVVLVSVGGTFAFSSLALQREFRKLPPDIQTYLRARDAALRRGETPPAPPRRPSTGPITPGTASPATASLAPAIPVSGSRPPWPVRQVDWLRGVQRQLLNIGLVAVAVSALLALWLARRIARPVTVVSQAAQRLAAGEQGVRVPVPTLERELAGLAHSFNGMAQNLEQLETERKQAVADIAHELRTPLAIMQARLDAMEDGIYPMSTEQITLLSTQTQLLTRLVGDLRTLTLLDAGQLALNMRTTDVARVTQAVTTQYQARAQARGIQLNVRHASPAPVNADPDRLRQMLSNLIENALRHARERIDVSVNSQNEWVVLHVDDDGAGIPPGRREQVFMRFTRLDESRHRDAGGSGLGLSIVQALAAAHGGSAQAEGSPLGGARLSVILPTCDLKG